MDGRIALAKMPRLRHRGEDCRLFRDRRRRQQGTTRNRSRSYFT